MSCPELVHLHCSGEQRASRQNTALLLPFSVPSMLGDWEVIMKAMLREIPVEFSRSDWAYLASFLQPEQLKSVYSRTFGELVQPSSPPENLPLGIIYKPRGQVAVWLPANVGLLGPLSIILVSISGNNLQIKGSIRGDAYSNSFLAFARKHAPTGFLRDYLHKQVNFDVFDRDDARNHQMSRCADVRIIFGSDTAVSALSQLQHKPTALTFGFTDHQSESWIASDSYHDSDIEMIVKIFSVYGQAGCTSPRRIVLIDGKLDEVAQLSDRILACWNYLNEPRPAADQASSSIFASQMGAVQGWKIRIASNNRGCLLIGEPDMPLVEATPALHLVAAPLEIAARTMPANIQTIGYLCSHSRLSDWAKVLLKFPIKRLVPLGEMHHFGPVWDGFEFWRNLFEAVEVR